jgi:hypothetical protein
MSVRLLLAAVVTMALLGSAVPAIDAAQEARAEHQLTGSVDRVRAAAADLARHSDPVPPGVPGSRRRIDVDIPEGPPAGSIRIVPSDGGNGPESGSIIVTRVDGERRSVHRADTKLWIPPVETTAPDGSLLVREDGVLVLERRLVDGTPVVAVSRGFKAEHRTSKAHAGTSGTGQ